MGTEEPGLHHFGGDKALGLCVSWNNGAGKLGARCSMGFEHRRWMEPVDTTIIGRPGEETSRDSLRQRHWKQVVWVGAGQNCAKAEKDGAILVIRCEQRWLSDSQ